MKMSAERRQIEYFRAAAADYDATHDIADEHGFALQWLEACIDMYGFESVLDVGCGTGRHLAELGRRRPSLRLAGVEPVPELRERAVLKGVEVSAGNGCSLPYGDDAVDVVTAFAVLHHVPNALDMLDEMLRVARRAVFVSDSNNFGQGRPTLRIAKRLVRQVGLWSAATWVRTRGRGFLVSDGDGVAYSFSVLDCYERLRLGGNHVYLLTTTPLDISADPLVGASHVALLAIFREAG